MADTTEYVILESYFGFKKILKRGSKYKLRKYGDIHIKDDLIFNQWYDLDYNRVEFSEKNFNLVDVIGSKTDKLHSIVKKINEDDFSNENHITKKGKNFENNINIAKFNHQFNKNNIDANKIFDAGIKNAVVSEKSEISLDSKSIDIFGIKGDVYDESKNQDFKNNISDDLNKKHMVTNQKNCLKEIQNIDSKIIHFINDTIKEKLQDKLNQENLILKYDMHEKLKSEIFDKILKDLDKKIEEYGIFLRKNIESDIHITIENLNDTMLENHNDKPNSNEHSQKKQIYDTKKILEADSEHENENVERDERTKDKYMKKKNKRLLKIFRIVEIAPDRLLEHYISKCQKSINYINTSVLSYINLYNSTDGEILLFDNIKNIGIFTLAYYKPHNLTVFRQTKGDVFDALKFLKPEDRSKINFFYGNDYKNRDEKKENDVSKNIMSHASLDENKENTDNIQKTTNMEISTSTLNRTDKKIFDTVIILGPYDYTKLVEKYLDCIGNLIIFYVYINSEAHSLFEYLLKNENFIDVTICDFMFREWQVVENVRPMMDCDMRCGFVIKATRIFFN